MEFAVFLTCDEQVQPRDYIASVLDTLVQLDYGLATLQLPRSIHKIALVKLWNLVKEKPSPAVSFESSSSKWSSRAIIWLLMFMSTITIQIRDKSFSRINIKKFLTKFIVILRAKFRSPQFVSHLSGTFECLGQIIPSKEEKYRFDE
jgi:hypothetical protein